MELHNNILISFQSGGTFKNYPFAFAVFGSPHYSVSQPSPIVRVLSLLFPEFQ